MQAYQYEIRYPTMTEGIFRLIVLFSISFVIQLIASIFSTQYFYPLVLTGGNHFHWISLFTHYFFFPVSIGGFLSFLFEMLLLWSFGSELELLWGTRNFYRYFFTGIFGGALSILLAGNFLLPNLVAYSPTAGITALLFAYANLFPNRQVLFFFVIPMKMKWVVLILFLMLTLGSASQLIHNLGGAIVAAVYLFITAKMGKLRYEYNQYSTRSSSQISRIFEEQKHQESFLQKIRNKIEEIKKKRRLEKKRNEILRRIEMKEELDRILEKISKHGMDSLTKEEKKFLDKASREL